MICKNLFILPSQRSAHLKIRFEFVRNQSWANTLTDKHLYLFLWDDSMRLRKNIFSMDGGSVWESNPPQRFYALPLNLKSREPTSGPTTPKAYIINV